VGISGPMVGVIKGAGVGLLGRTLNLARRLRRELFKVGGAAAPTPTQPAPSHPSSVASRPSPDQRTLVMIQLGGGDDGLNLLVPYGNGTHYDVRPKVAIPQADVLPLDHQFGLHPGVKAFERLYDEGKLALIQGVGYPSPSRSHFRSMDIWHSAYPDKDVTTSGWIGRFFDNACPGCDPHVGIAMGDQLPVAMRGEQVIPLSFDKPENYRYNGSDTERYQKLNTAPDTKEAGEVRKDTKTGKKIEIATPSSQLDFLTRTAMDAQISSDSIIKMTRGHMAQYPGFEFGQSLKTVAAMIKGGLPTRVYYVTLGGFDTRAGGRGRHDQLMNQFAGGVSAFWKDMKEQGNDQRVLMMTFSEFGRRVASNASGGTDHGAAAPMFLFGPACKQAVVGKHPSLSDLDQGDLKYGIDFRSVYASVLQNWMDTPSKPILGGQFPTLPVIKA
jgi:uncharacterized protein (DUF1501 family)